MKKIAILGGSGRLGSCLKKQLKNYFKIIPSSKKSYSTTCDISKLLSIKKFVAKYKPDIIINAVALTSIELCEKNPQKAFKINSESIIKLLKVIPNKTYFIQISTDQVYPNDLGPFKENQIAKKGSNIYANSKIRAEKLSRKHRNHLILRTNFFGKSISAKRKSLSDIIIETSKKEIEMPLFEDLFFSPLHMNTLCQYIKKCINRNLNGTFNLGTNEGISKAEFALKILDFLNLQSRTFYIENSDKMGDRILRSKDLRLDCTLIEKKLLIKLPSIEQEINKLKTNN
jgi:dTDP-4-dehydrorhamnose reductase